MRRLTVISVISLFLFAQVSFAEVSQFVFTTEPQSVPLNTQSGTITVQSQNSTGTAEDVQETMDFVFTSSSPAGQFLSTSGNVVTNTMSRNTSNKNFLYKDSVVGNYVISISITGRTSGKTFSVSQPVSVVSEGSLNQSPATTTNSSTEETTTSNTTTSNVTTYSAHSSQNALSGTENKIDFEVSSGRDRIALAGNKIYFNAVPTKLQNVSAGSMVYEWSFGDGFIQKGQNLVHSYKFAGDYVVVLNAYSSDKQATSRTKVRIIEPNFVLKKVLGGIEVYNKTAYEVNLEGWVLSDKYKTFEIPKDTLISSNNKVIFDDRITGVVSDSFRLSNPDGRVFDNQTILLASSSPIITTTPVSSSEQKITKQVSVKNTTETKNEKLTSSTDSIVSTSTQVANTVTIFQAKNNTGLITKLFLWPVDGMRYISKIFSSN
jgi:hypothetical protein